jgi:hypothetical protein
MRACAVNTESHERWCSLEAEQGEAEHRKEEPGETGSPSSFNKYMYKFANKYTTKCALTHKKIFIDNIGSNLERNNNYLSQRTILL